MTYDVCCKNKECISRVTFTIEKAMKDDFPLCKHCGQELEKDYSSENSKIAIKTNDGFKK